MTLAVMEAPAIKKGKAGGITMPTASLRDALTKISPALAGATTIPVLKNVKVEVGETLTSFTATNLEMSIRVTVPSASNGGAAFLMPSERLLTYAKLLQGQYVSLSPSERRVTLKCGRATTQFPTSKSEEFPRTVFGVSGDVLTLQQGQLLELLRHTVFAVSEEESRYVLKGALVVAENDTVTVVATDGHRLAQFTVPCDGVARANYLIPSDFLKALAKILVDSSENPVTLGENGDSIACELVSDAAVSLSHRKLVGMFPNYKAVIPSGSMVASFDVQVDDMLSSLTRCVAMADKNSGAVKMTFTPDKIVMRAVDAEAGETEEEISIGSLDPFEKFAVGFNGEYLTDVLRRIDGNCNFSFAKADANSPLKVTHTTEEGGELVYVVMPMRV